MAESAVSSEEERGVHGKGAGNFWDALDLRNVRSCGVVVKEECSTYEADKPGQESRVSHVKRDHCRWGGVVPLRMGSSG